MITSIIPRIPHSNNGHRQLIVNRSLSAHSVFVDNTPDELKIIREFYLNENSNEAQEYFESELEAALEARTKLIVIEPKQFGQATARYIYIGECRSNWSDDQS